MTDPPSDLTADKHDFSCVWLRDSNTPRINEGNSAAAYRYTPAAFASMIAWRTDPATVSFRFVTVKVFARIGAHTKSNALNASAQGRGSRRGFDSASLSR
jgi:hypothetical protein